MNHSRLFILAIAFVSTLSEGTCGAEHHPVEQRGLSSLVDRIKIFFNLGSSKQEAPKAEPQQSPAPAQPPSPSVEPRKMLQAPAISAVKKEESTIEARMGEYKKFEEEMLGKEEEMIRAIEDNANKKREEIMASKRVTYLMRRNPNVTLEELPEDIYSDILRISSEEESFISTVMDETDTKLFEKAMALGVYEQLNKEEQSRAEDKQRRLDSLKEKVTGSVGSISQ